MDSGWRLWTTLIKQRQTSKKTVAIAVTQCEWTLKVSFTLSNCDCDVTNKWVLLSFMVLFTLSDEKH